MVAVSEGALEFGHFGDSKQGWLLRRAIPLLSKEGWTRDKEKPRSLLGRADGVVRKEPRSAPYSVEVTNRY
jgi:hypothetical protein